MRSPLLVAASTPLLLLLACGDSGSSGGDDGPPPGGDDAAVTRDGAPGRDAATTTDGAPSDGSVAPPVDLAMKPSPDLAVRQYGTIFTILLENHDYAEIVGSANAPYINSLIADYGLATAYQDSLVHPSLPNYLYLISGSTQGISADVSPTTAPFPVAGENLGDQLETAAIPWRAYAESMPKACDLSSVGTYAARHVPFLYFSDIQKKTTVCQNRIVDFTHFGPDLAAGTYRYMWITPNLVDDGHDPDTDPVLGLQDTDSWLKGVVPTILASKAWQDGGVLFVTWDEAEGRNGDDPDQVPMIVVSPFTPKGFTSKTPHDHASYLATVEDIFHLSRIGAAKTATSLTEFLP